MSTKLGLSQLKAWSSLLVGHARIFQKIEREFDAEKGVVPFHWYDVLFILNQQKEKQMRLSELAETIVTSKSALTRSIDKMEEAGLVKKVQCAEDKRGQYAVMTAKGHAALKVSWPHYRTAIYNHFGKYLTGTEARELERLLTKVSGPQK
jgi:DNA-binding MarR family transcriptional regulator